MKRGRRQVPVVWYDTGRYTLAVALVGAAVLLRWLFPHALAGAPYLAFYPAVVAAAALGGAGPGVLATVLSWLCVDLLFDSTPGWIAVHDPVVQGRFLIFVAGGVGISIVAGLWRAGQARQQAQAAQLRQSEGRFRRFYESGMVGAMYWHADGRFLDANDRFLQIVGCRREDLAAGRLDWRDLTPPEFHSADQRALEELMAQGVCTPYEKEYLRPDGRRVAVIVSLATLDEAGSHGIGFVLDITERTRAEEALRQSEARFRIVADNARSVFGIVQGTRFVYANPYLAEISGYSIPEILAMDFVDLVEPADRPQVADYARRRQLGQDVPPHYEFRMRTKAGQTRWLDFSAGRTEYRGQPAVVGTAYDITDRKKAEADLQAAKAAAEEANRTKDHFLAVLSHELRNPLTPVTAAVALLRATPGFDADTRENLEMIHRNVELEARLIDDLLDMTRIARGKIELFKSPIELCQVLNRAIEVCQPDLEAGSLHFGVQWGPRPYWVRVDVGRLQQVFWNLLKNAIKFTPHNGCVGIRCYRENGQAVVEVLDSGIGIEPEALPRLFNAFEQAERTITRQFGGLGLGLTISKTLVELHGGTIEAHSAGKGQGALFRVRLPETASAGPPGPAPTATDTGAERRAIPRKLRILLVEDHGDTARVMRQFLRADGHEVQVAGDVATALALLQGHPFDLLISDMGLPDASGLDLIRELRRRGYVIPGIALSGYGQEQDIQNSLEAGFAVHLTKPANLDQLRLAIATVVPSRR